MLRLLHRIHCQGQLTEALPEADSEQEALGLTLKQKIDQRFSGSLSIRMIDAGSCNGCELELHALHNPYYDIERFGLQFVASPRHADVLLVTGVVSRHMQMALRRTWRAMARPRFVIACGDCACNGGEFGGSYASCGTLDNVLPVDLRIAGCPPNPTQLMAGLLALCQQGGIK